MMILRSCTLLSLAALAAGAPLAAAAATIPLTVFTPWPFLLLTRVLAGLIGVERECVSDQGRGVRCHTPKRTPNAPIAGGAACADGSGRRFCSSP